MEAASYGQVLTSLVLDLGRGVVLEVAKGYPR